MAEAMVNDQRALDSFTVIIPARYASTRLPGKPLAIIGDKPMIQHVYERACQSCAKQVVVATDDQRIANAVNRFGGQSLMTATTHDSGTNRLQEAASLIGLDEKQIVVNVQGDEPCISPKVIDQVAVNLQQHDRFAAATLCEAVTSEADLINPNVVKVVMDMDGRALYFSRAAIPFVRDNTPVRDSAPAKAQTQTNAIPAYRHIGIYAYRVDLLNRFVGWPMAALEKLECLEQLRILYQGEAIHVAQAVTAVPGGVDTEEDLARIRQDLRVTS